jgi:hypothetical protein
LLFLRTSPHSIWDRGIVPRMNEQFIQRYARKLGGTHNEIHEYFVREQEMLAKLFSQSRIEKLLLENEGNADGIVNAAHKFWTEPQ